MMTAKPIRMYDALATILGLGQLSEAQQRLADREKELAEPEKRAKAVLDSLCAALAETDDAGRGRQQPRSPSPPTRSRYGRYSRAPGPPTRRS